MHNRRQGGPGLDSCGTALKLLADADGARSHKSSCIAHCSGPAAHTPAALCTRCRQRRPAAQRASPRWRANCARCWARWRRTGRRPQPSSSVCRAHYRSSLPQRRRPFCSCRPSATGMHRPAARGRRRPASWLSSSSRLQSFFLKDYSETGSRCAGQCPEVQFGRQPLSHARVSNPRFEQASPVHSFGTVAHQTSRHHAACPFQLFTRYPKSKGGVAATRLYYKPQHDGRPLFTHKSQNIAMACRNTRVQPTHTSAEPGEPSHTPSGRSREHAMQPSINSRGQLAKTQPGLQPTPTARGERRGPGQENRSAPARSSFVERNEEGPPQRLLLDAQPTHAAGCVVQGYQA